MPVRMDNNGAHCGGPFSCQQVSGCWCAAMCWDPATLEELGLKFCDCLCEAWLRIFAANQK
jgi:hypothetical protein